MLSIRKLARTELPSLPYEKIASQALGSDYDLSLVTIGHTRSRFLNRTRRGKDKPTNVLSFPLSKKEGELFLDLALMKKEAVQQREFFPNFRDYTLYIFIHGLFHLAGLDHGRIMENKEKKLLDSWRETLSHHSTLVRRR
jgi:probable rRNA maturation factor